MNSEIERLAKEARVDWLTANFNEGVRNVTLYTATPEQLAKFAALVAEECAKECDLLAEEATPTQQFALDLASDTIRAKFARGELEDAAK